MKSKACNQELQDIVAYRLMEMAAHVIMCHLLIQDATNRPDLLFPQA